MKTNKAFSLVEACIILCIVGLIVAIAIPSLQRAKQKAELEKQGIKETVLTAKSSDRFSVTRVSKFDDDLAYNGSRGIYIIKDTETGKEFVGISGVGISEMGSHLSGKARHSDEQ